MNKIKSNPNSYFKCVNTNYYYWEAKAAFKL